MANQQAPVPFINPITGKMEVMPVEMIGAYLPYAGDLDLQKAAELAAIRDDEAAQNLMLSVTDPLGKMFNLNIPEGLPILDETTIEPVVMA
jgi:hypothetical protein